MVSLDIIFSNKQTTKVLIKLHGRAGWSAHLLFANHGRRVFSGRGPHVISPLSLLHRLAYYTIVYTYIINKAYYFISLFQIVSSTVIVTGKIFCFYNTVTRQSRYSRASPSLVENIKIWKSHLNIREGSDYSRAWFFVVLA